MSLSQVPQIWAEVNPVIWLVTSRFDHDIGGLTATFVNQASITSECPRMVIGLSRQHHTNHLVEKSGAFALHLLEEKHVEWVWRFGLESGWKGGKFQGIHHEVRATGSPILTEARGWMDCRVEARLDAGDRTLYLAEVVEAEHHPGSQVLTVQRLLQLAPADKRQLLDKLHERDAVIDAEAIRAWRKKGCVKEEKSHGEPR
jgi:flavin reductase (DIM6/NTAB) family NADH-FMN oxidoreductase RutF